jgi:hypothetical protein
MVQAQWLSYHRTALLMIRSVSEEYTTPIVRNKWDNYTSELETAGFSEAVVTIYQTTRCYNPGNHNLNLHRRENLNIMNYCRQTPVW